MIVLSPQATSVLILFTKWPLLVTLCACVLCSLPGAILTDANTLTLADFSCYSFMRCVDNVKRKTI